MILGAAGAGSPFGGSSPSVDLTDSVSAPRCFHARAAVPFYRETTWDWQSRRFGALADRTPIVRGKSCHWARYASTEWVDRSRSARRSFYRWTREHTLRDFPFSPGGRAWHRAVREAQKVFPGTESWLLSCSAAEGGWGRWVGYSGVSYSERLRDSDTVGGPMQYRFSTFTGHYRRAVDYLRERHYFVPRAIRRDWTNAWTSALGQALAAGWARYTGNDASHWSASWGNGC